MNDMNCGGQTTAGRRRRTDDGGASGFTLLELLLALTILSIIIVIISGAFRIGVRAWERGEAYTQDRQRYRVVLEFMKRQIASVYTGTSANRHPLKGTEKTLDFMSLVPLNPKNRFGIVRARYDIIKDGDREQLIFSEINQTDAGLKPEHASFRHRDVLIGNISEMFFEYLAEKDRETVWVSSWNSEKDYPKAVRIFFRPDPDAAPITVIVRIIPEISG